MHPEKIVSVEKIGLIDTMDIEVDNESHLFYGNGIATSNSHSQSYAIMAYASAYLKVHYPREFYCAWLTHARDKQNPFEEIKELVNDAKVHDINICGPDLRNQNQNFSVISNSVCFGLNNIRDIGEKAYEKLIERVADRVFADWTDFLLFALLNLSSKIVEALIGSGAVDYFGESRQKMMYEYGNANDNLTENDIKYLTTLQGTFMERLTQISPTTKINNRKIPTKKYEMFSSLLSLLKSPPFSLEDTVDFIVWNEEKYLGAALNWSVVDGKDTSQANCPIIDIIKNRVKEYICVAAVIESVRENAIKNGRSKGKLMAYLAISDSTGYLNSVVVFPDQLKEFGEYLIEGNTVLIRGNRGKDKEGFIVEKVWPL